MRVVKPSFSMKIDLDGEGILRRIEQAGRTCYKSEDRVTEIERRVERRKRKEEE